MGELGPEPETIGPYRIIGKLGEGSSAVVYRGVDPTSGREVAVKASRELSADLALFRREISTLSRLRHPRIVHIYDDGIDAGTVWYAMEPIRGATLDEYRRSLWPAQVSTSSVTEPARAPATTAVVSGGPRPRVAGGSLGPVLDLFRRLCVPLAVLHEHGLVHRDLKPSNVMLRPDGDPVVLDLGFVARARGAVGREALDAHGRPIGTFAYMSPEQARGAPVDARADLYALGVMLYECLTGQLPIEGARSRDMFARIVWEPPIPPSELADGVPRELESLVLALLAKSPRHRLGHVEDVARALESLGARDDEACISVRPYLHRPEIVGRAAELELFDHCFARVLGGGANTILVSGESGVGKTFFVGHVASRARAAGLEVVLAESAPATSESSHETWTSTGRPLGALVPLLEAIGDAARQRGLELDGARFAAAFREVAAFDPHLGELAAPPEPGAGARTADLVRERAYEALHALVETWVRAMGAAVLVLDDLQWSDELSLGWIVRLLRVPIPRLLVVGTYRSEQVTPALRALVDEPGSISVPLSRLTTEHLVEMTRDMLALSSVPTELERVLARASEGNPFFAAEYLRMAIARGMLERDRGRWSLVHGAELSALPVPRSIGELLAQRFEGLEEDVRAVAEAAAVLGRELDENLLRALEPRDEATLSASLRELQRREILAPLGGTAHVFVHDKLRDAAYELVPPARRKRLHRRAAELLEAAHARTGDPAPHAVLANHWRAAEEIDRAMAHLEAAGEAALAASSNTDAVARFEEVIALAERASSPPAPLRRVRWEVCLARAHHGLGACQAVQRHGARALAALGRPHPEHTLARLLGVMSTVVRLANPWRSRAVPKDSIERLAAVAEIDSLLIEPLLQDLQFTAGVYAGLRAIDLGARLDPSAALARAYGMMAGLAGIVGLDRTADAWSARSIAMAEALGDDDLRAKVFSLASVVHFTRGTWDVLAEARARAAKVTMNVSTRRRDEARMLLGLAAAARGFYQDSLAEGRRALPGAIERADRELEVWARAMITEALTRRGQPAEARSIAREGEVLLPRVSALERFWIPSVAALAALRAGDEQDALRLVQDALEAGRARAPVTFFTVSAVATFAEVTIELWSRAKADGRPDTRARALDVERALHFLSVGTRRVRYARPFELLWRGVFAARRGRSNARRSLERALEEAEAKGLVHVCARAHAELARLTEGDVQRSHLRAAVAGFDQLGVVADREHALAALGAPSARTSTVDG